ncbi:hypothetical protein J8I29_21180 [Labrys sp. LIt4]|uniref:hypothetical protein n=1 Tax=Labrys sp. LIt4 TaxID=2821355 RepID=UPI001ADFE6C0|nr:hypothetical protein [Labrys sp. LIt4]MBP0581856.1 hypothetical protein [Labrys sp. LIt4]
MSDYTLAFEELHLVEIGGLLAGPLDGAAHIGFGLSPTAMRFDSIKLNVWNPRERKASFTTLREGDPWFDEICNALVIDAVYGALIAEAVEGHWCQKPSAYDRARDRREAA